MVVPLVKNLDGPKKILVFENSIEFVQILENKGSKFLKEEAIVF